MSAVYQDAVEELVNEESQCGRQDVCQVIEELHIHHHGLVPHNKCAVVPHKTHHKHHFIDELEMDKTWTAQWMIRLEVLLPKRCKRTLANCKK